MRPKKLQKSLHKESSKKKLAQIQNILSEIRTLALLQNNKDQIINRRQSVPNPLIKYSGKVVKPNDQYFQPVQYLKSSKNSKTTHDLNSAQNLRSKPKIDEMDLPHFKLKTIEPSERSKNIIRPAEAQILKTAQENWIFNEEIEREEEVDEILSKMGEILSKRKNHGWKSKLQNVEKTQERAKYVQEKNDKSFKEKREENFVVYNSRSTNFKRNLILKKREETISYRMGHQILPERGERLESVRKTEPETSEHKKISELSERILKKVKSNNNKLYFMFAT